jgi:hypothetical protein
MKNPAAEALDPDVVEKLGKIFLVMSSSIDGDKLVAMHALDKALKKNNVDYHVLVARMTKPWLSDSAKELFKTELNNARALGREEALRESEGKRASADVFLSTDGSDDWRQMALSVEREKHRLSGYDQTEWSREFIDDMATRARLLPDYQVRPKQLVQLRRFFVRLGGKIT